jgi:hypothetical protein
VSQFSAGKGISAMDNPPYAPNFAPPDFWLYPNLKSLLTLYRYSGVEGIRSALKKKSADIHVQDFKNWFNNGRSLENILKIGERLF